ncbi:MAG: hypothetical protein WAN65_03490 [Candidatus Sulfotelmatobacter sp.]
MLLNDIITLATDDTKSLSSLLRKCLVLAHEIKNERLKNWANQELNGYAPSDQLPDYRIIPADSKEPVAGPFGSGSSHWPLPSISVKGHHRQREEEVCLMEAVSAYETLIKDAEAIEGESPRFETPTEIFTYYRRKHAPNQRGMVLVGAAQEIPKSALIGVLENVQTRTLNIAIEIKGELGERDEALARVTPDKSASIEQKVIKLIHGGINAIASDNPE